MRRGCAHLFKFARIFLLGGFFVCCSYGAWQAQAHYYADLLPIHDGNIAANSGWQCVSCDQGSSGGNDYLILKKSDSTLISPSLDLTGVAEANLTFQARTYNGLSASSSRINTLVSTDGGNYWRLISSTMPASSVLALQPEINLADYLEQTVIIKFETPAATGSKGVGLDQILLNGRYLNQPPLVEYFATPTAAVIDEPVGFAGDNSTDTDGYIVSFLWSFGDGGFAASPTASHAYQAAGEFIAVLNITDDDGATSSSSTMITIVGNATPATTTPSSTPMIATTTATGMIVINEFQSNPASGGKEWLELYNKTTSSVDLTGWVLNDNSSTSTLTGIIGTSTSNYFIFEFPSSRLNNDGDTIILKDSAGKIINRIAYGNFDDGDLSDNATAPGMGFSAARKIDGQDTFADRADFTETITPTRGSTNIITSRPATGGGSGGGSAPINPAPKTETAPTGTIVYAPVASGTKIIINEILPNPTGADEINEFIELKNIGSQVVDLAGWSISDATDNKFIFADAAIDWKINANGFLLIKRDQSQIALNNSGTETVKLFTPDGRLWDETQYVRPAAEDSSYSRSSDGESYWTASSTPGKENQFPAEAAEEMAASSVLGIKIFATSSDKKILISEILPVPDIKSGQAEFIELYNPNDEPLDLSGFSLSDQSGKSYIFKDRIIGSLEYLPLYQTESKISLNNDGDSLTIKSAAGQIVTQLSYVKAPQDYSLALSDDGKFLWTDTITPGRKNIISAPPENIASTGSSKTSNKKTAITVSLSDIRNYDNGQKVIATGTVSAEPGILGANIFYLAGSGLPATLRVAMQAGIQVYCYKKDFPPLLPGDIIEVTGELAESGGERRIKITDRSAIKIIGRGDPPAPHEIATSEVGEDYEGSLVSAKGQLLEIKGRYLYLDDGSGETAIYLKPSIKDLELKTSGRLIVTGIVTQTAAGYRLLPRYSSDIVIEKSTSSDDAFPLSSTRNIPSEYYWIAIAIFFIAVSGIIGMKVYKDKIKK